jgi:hypothetical protein
MLRFDKTMTSLRTLFAVAVLASLGCASRQAESRDRRSHTPVDSFALGRVSVEVHFFEPTLFIGRMYPDFARADVPDSVKGALWLDYLHHSPIYLFSVRDGSGVDLKQFCIRGDPQIEGTAAFYKVVIIPGNTRGACDPNVPEDARLAEKTERAKGARGSLFEHMATFERPEMKKYVGNGVMIFGKYDRVTPYAEVKSAMVDLIRAELE